MARLDALGHGAFVLSAVAKGPKIAEGMPAGAVVDRWRIDYVLSARVIYFSRLAPGANVIAGSIGVALKQFDWGLLVGGALISTSPKCRDRHYQHRCCQIGIGAAGVDRALRTTGDGEGRDAVEEKDVLDLCCGTKQLSVDYGFGRARAQTALRFLLGKKQMNADRQQRRARGLDIDL